MMRRSLVLLPLLVLLAVPTGRAQAAGVDPGEILQALTEALRIAQQPVDGVALGSLPTDGVTVEVNGVSYVVSPSPSGEGTFVRPSDGPVDGIDEVFLDFSLTMMIIEGMDEITWLNAPPDFNMVLTHSVPEDAAETEPSVSALGFSRYGADPDDPTNLTIMVGADNGDMIVRDLQVSFDPRTGPGRIEITADGVTGALFGPPVTTDPSETDEPAVVDATDPTDEPVDPADPAELATTDSLPRQALSAGGLGAVSNGPLVMTSLDYQANPQLSPRPEDVDGGSPSPSSL